MAEYNMKTKVCAFVILLVLGVIIYLAIRPNVHPPECPEGTFTNGAVAADNVKCSEIGLNILKKGGTAVEAAIAALLCTGIMNPHTAGIGGGSIFTIMDKSGDVTFINSKETAPLTMSEKPDLLDSCPDKPSQANESKWIGVPGEIRGYELAHKLYKNLKWSDLFSETIKLAREGSHISLLLSSHFPEIKETESLRKLYSDKNGNLLKHGDMIRYEKLADTLELVANEGPDAFYSGRIADNLVKVSGGNLTLEDLKSYRATVNKTSDVLVGAEYRMYIPPPPSGGSLLRLVLDFMKEFENKSAPQSVEEKTEFYNLYVQALKQANEQKKNIQDPRFAPQQAKKMTNINSVKNIQDNRTLRKNVCRESVGTTHVSAVDQYGTFVSVTSSINGIFGSKVYSPNTGILLNNQLWDFCHRDIDKITKVVFPGERPPSSMAPVVLKSKSGTLAIGASGGNWITTGIASALINHLWFGKSLKEAIDTPVVYVDSENKMKLEPSFNITLIKELEALGHELGNKFYNVVNAVVENNGYICAVSDERKLGKAAGY